MGYVSLIFNCIACNRRACGNPHKVPSLRVTPDEDGIAQVDPLGTREPLCEDCAKTVNENRAKAGLKPIEIAADAYEPITEHAL